MSGEQLDPPREGRHHVPGDKLAHYREYLAMRLEECDVPGHLRSGLVAYFTQRQPVGGFLTACLENDLQQAVLRADAVNELALGRIVEFLVYHAPATAWGSTEAVAAWLSSTEHVPTPFD